MPIFTSHGLYPPFPSTLETAPLVSISLAKLENNDEPESKAFFRACKDLGFFYLDTEGSTLGEKLVEGAEALQKVQQQFFARPIAEKEEYAREKIDEFFGYRHTNIEIEGFEGERDEVYNMRKDDIIGNCTPLPCHPLAKENQAVMREYVFNCRRVMDLMMTHLEVHLELPIGTITDLHRIGERSGDHVRFNQAAIQPFDEKMARRGEHTDFGTLTILFNWLGGLQIRRPDTDEWVYVKPIPGSAVVNLGDALVKFTAGILRSNVHRVVPPPSPQDGVLRNSLVYFSRPEDAVVLERLRGGRIDAQPAGREQEAKMTASEWTFRRSVGDMKGVFTHKGGLESKRRNGAGS